MVSASMISDRVPQATTRYMCVLGDRHICFGSMRGEQKIGGPRAQVLESPI